MEMDARFEEIVASAMKLSDRERARLAQELIASLETEIEPDVEALWLAEAERRVEELRSGKVKGIPAEEAFARVRRTLRR
jgi:putative addiction module component (TIGR02574 family)